MTIWVWGNERGLYPVKLILWAAQYTKASLHGAACEKETEGYWTHLLNLGSDPEPGVPLFFLFDDDDFGGIIVNQTKIMQL